MQPHSNDHRHYPDDWAHAHPYLLFTIGALTTFGCWAFVYWLTVRA